MLVIETSMYYNAPSGKHQNIFSLSPFHHFNNT